MSGDSRDDQEGPPTVQVGGETIAATPAGFFNYFYARGGASLILRSDCRGDPRLVLPDYVRDLPQVHLMYDLDPVVPITDLVVTDEGVAATLSFSRVPCRTFVPWDVVEFLMPRAPDAPPEPPRPAKPSRSHLKLV